MANAVWLYYYRYHSPYAESFDGLTSAMHRAQFMTDDMQAAIQAVVDTDGKIYTLEAIEAWMKAYHEAQPVPAREPGPTEYREWNGERWEVL